MYTVSCLMTSLENAFLSFASHILQGKEGVFFSVKGKTSSDSWVFGVGDRAVDVSFDGDVFPVFSCFGYEGRQSLHKTFETIVKSDDVFEEGDFKTVEDQLSDTWIDLEKDLESCTNETKKSFAQKIHDIQDAQRQGEMWVCNLTHALCGKLTDKYIVLAAFLRFLKADSPHVGGVWWVCEQLFCSFSPEMFLHLEGNVLTTCPVKGTGTLKMLEESEKEISELSMVTDLLRNDLGMISEKVWVESERFITQQRDFYQAQVSICSSLDEEGLTQRRLKKLLPAGSITGCPKKRVCEYIDQLEGYDRKWYTGIFGVRISPERAWYNILIRTLFVEGDEWSFPVGGGITHLSDVSQEWAETLLKAGSLKEFCLKNYNETLKK